MMNDLGQDLRFAFRSFWKTPLFAAVVALTLALGIGANTAIFGLLDQLLIRPLPVAEPERLVILDGPGPYSGRTTSQHRFLTPMSHPMFEGFRDRSSVFSGVLARCAVSIHFSSGGETEEVNADLVSGTFFSLLGVKPAAGRLLTREDDRNPGAHPVVVLSHRFWQRRFAADPAVVGQRILVNGHPMTVVGVSERGFHGIEVGESMDVFAPLMMQAQVLPTWSRGLGDWRMRWLTVMARLRDGVSLSEARAESNVLYRQLLQQDLETVETSSESFRARFASKEVLLLPGGRGTSFLREQAETPLLVLMGMVGLVLLIACANVANLLLARASARRREIALRIAIGASRRRLVRQLLVESILLALAGGAVGILLASWTGDFLLGALPFEGVSEAFSAQPSLRLLLFALILSALTGIAFGAVPALQSTRPEIAPTLKNETGTSSGRSSSSRFRKALVVVQVALSLLLLVGAGLFVRSLQELSSLDPGFEPERLLAFNVDPSLNGYELDRRVAVLRHIRDEIAAEPRVLSVSLAEVALMTNSRSSSTVMVEGYEAEEGEDMNPGVNGVGPGFFSTLSMPLLAGRDFTDSDDLEAPKVAIVNESFARYFFGDSDPLGRRIGFRRNETHDITIVGVVRDGKSASLREEPERFLYVPYTQSPDLGSTTFYVRAAGEPEALGGRIHELVASIDPALPVSDLKSMRAQIEESLYVERLVAALSVAFGALATLLAAVGLYGLLSYAVSLRTRELGIRIALGAERRGVLLLVLKEASVLAAAGVALGLPAGFALGRLVESQLYGLDAWDPPALALATLALVLVTLFASFLPAARASRVDPMTALRHE